jgi:hypothetical protein
LGGVDLRVIHDGLSDHSCEEPPLGLKAGPLRGLDRIYESCLKNLILSKPGGKPFDSSPFDDRLGDRKAASLVTSHRVLQEDAHRLADNRDTGGEGFEDRDGSFGMGWWSGVIVHTWRR